MKRPAMALAFAALLVLPHPGLAADFTKGDKVCIHILGIPVPEQDRINGTYSIGDDGMLHLPLIAPLKADGMSPAKLGIALEKAYKDAGIFARPSVEAKPPLAPGGGGPALPPVNIGGQVHKPGPVALVAGLTLKQAIDSAGGPNEFGGNRPLIKLVRDGKVRYLDCRKPSDRDLVLEPGDAVTVQAHDERQFGEH